MFNQSTGVNWSPHRWHSCCHASRRCTEDPHRWRCQLGKSLEKIGKWRIWSENFEKALWHLLWHPARHPMAFGEAMTLPWLSHKKKRPSGAQWPWLFWDRETYSWACRLVKPPWDKSQDFYLKMGHQKIMANGEHDFRKTMIHVFLIPDVQIDPYHPYQKKVYQKV